jgi:hypothetical protein
VQASYADLDPPSCAEHVVLRDRTASITTWRATWQVTELFSRGGLRQQAHINMPPSINTIHTVGGEVRWGWDAEGTPPPSANLVHQPGPGRCRAQ